MASGTLASLLIKLGVDASQVEAGMAVANKSLGGFAVNSGQAFKVAAGAIGGGLAFAAKGAVEMENRAAAFQAETGASAEEARHFADVVNASAGSSLVAMDDIAMSATKIRTDLGLTGEEADKTLEAFLRYERATGQGSDAVLAFDDILDNWNLTAADAQGIMDQLIVSHQKFGGSIEDNQTTLAALAPAMRAANMEIDDGVALLNLFGAKGLDANSASAAFAKALTKVESPEELQRMIEDISATEDPFERASKAADLFGARAGAKLANALGGANLDDYKVSVEEAAGATEKAADALDSTMTSRLKKALNYGLSLVRGFGMEVGPVLTGAMAGVNFAKALGLDRIIGPLFKPLGGKAAAVFAAGFSGGKGLLMKLIGPMERAMGPMFDSLGQKMGGRFGTAFKGVALLALGVAIAEGLRQLGEVRQANVEASAKIDKDTDAFLASMPSRAEVEERLAGLKAIPGELDGVQGAVYGFSDLAKGNVLGSVVDGLFGSNPAQVLDNKVKVLENYLATMPADMAPATENAGQGIGNGIVSGIKTAVTNAVGSVTTAAAASAATSSGKVVGNRWAAGVSEGIRNNVTRIQSSVDVINSAMQKGPELVPYKKRLQQFENATKTVLKRMRAAVKANDPAAAAYYAEQYQSIRTAQNQFRSSSRTVWGDVKTIISEASGNVGGKVGQLVDKVTTETGRAQRKVTRDAIRAGRAWPQKLGASVKPTATAAQDMATAATTPMQKVANQSDTYGAHAGDNFADGLRSQQGDVGNSAQALANAVRQFIAFSSPPRKGPLRTIRQWGPHMVKHWTSTTERSLSGVRRTAARWASAAAPSGLTGPSLAAARVSVPGGPAGGTRGFQGAHDEEVHIHIGTLIADDRGLDELERRMDRRRRIKGRSHQRYNDPS